jgi:hypothetical protein
MTTVHALAYLVDTHFPCSKQLKIELVDRELTLVAGLHEVCRRRLSKGLEAKPVVRRIIGSV